MAIGHFATETHEWPDALMTVVVLASPFVLSIGLIALSRAYLRKKGEAQARDLAALIGLVAFIALATIFYPVLTEASKSSDSNVPLLIILGLLLVAYLITKLLQRIVRRYPWREKVQP